MTDSCTSPNLLALQVGSDAPRFRLRRTFEEDVTPTPGRPVVIAFYVFDFGAF